MAKSNPGFWKKKIETNISRDLQKIKLLQSQGWRVITIWECELKPTNRDARYKKLIEEIGG